MKVIIDADTGTDDAIALIMAVNSPELQIDSVTTVSGNASLADTTRNTLRLLSHLGRPHIPISKGADRPLESEPSFAYHYHGPGGLTTSLPTTDRTPIQTHAPEHIIQAVNQAAGDLEIIALGPLTNVAQAIQRDPERMSRVRRIYVMGGAVEVPGNITPSAEFNIYADPHAANVVLDSGIPITLVGLDVGDAVGFDRNATDWRSGTTKGPGMARMGPREVNKVAAQIIQGWFDLHPDRDVYVLCDPLTVAAAVAPDLFEYRQGTVTVDESGEHRGRTIAEYGPGNVSIALTVDEDRARSFVLDRLATNR